MGLRPQKPVSLMDVARRAKVSTATVSRVLNNHGPVSELARQHVLRAARALSRRIEAGHETSTITLIPARLVIRAPCGCRPGQA